jgi:hypothetical protein
MATLELMAGRRKFLCNFDIQNITVVEKVFLWNNEHPESLEFCMIF